MIFSLKRKADKYLLLVSFLYFLQYFQLNGFYIFMNNLSSGGERRKKALLCPSKKIFLYMLFIKCFSLINSVSILSGIKEQI